ASTTAQGESYPRTPDDHHKNERGDEPDQEPQRIYLFQKCFPYGPLFCRSSFSSYSLICFWACSQRLSASRCFLASSFFATRTPTGDLFSLSHDLARRVDLRANDSVERVASPPENHGYSPLHSPAAA